MIKTVLIDTSFLIACAEFKIDYFSEIERILSFEYRVKVLDKVITELNHLIENGEMKKKQSAKLAKTILEKKNVEIMTIDKKINTDDALVFVADKETVVATIDAELKKRLKKNSYGIIFIRQKKYIKMLQN